MIFFLISIFLTEDWLPHRKRWESSVNDLYEVNSNPSFTLIYAIGAKFAQFAHLTSSLGKASSMWFSGLTKQSRLFRRQRNLSLPLSVCQWKLNLKRLIRIKYKKKI